MYLILILMKIGVTSCAVDSEAFILMWAESKSIKKNSNIFM